MKYKTIFVLVCVCFLIFGGINFVLAEETETLTFGEDVMLKVESLDLVEGMPKTLDGIIYKDYEGVVEVRFLIGKIAYAEPFEKISSEAISNHESFVKVDKQNEKVIEADFSMHSAQDFIFGNNKFCVPANSRIIFDGATINLKADKDTIFDCLPSILDSNLLFNEMGIEGKNIKLSEDIEIIDGKVNAGLEGVLVEKGQVNYKQNLISVENTMEEVLIPNNYLEDFSGNLVFQDRDNLIIESSDSGEINLQILENHRILNTDSKDELFLRVYDGDMINIKNRKDQGLIPLVNIKKSIRGRSVINNDGLENYFLRNEYTTDIGKMPSTKEDFEGIYQSVAMEIESDLMKNENLVINSYRQFNIVSKNNEELVTFNKYGLPISTKIKDNELQTIDQMREKYPNMHFETYYDWGRGRDFYLENTPPYLLYVTDQFFKENPDSLEDLDRIIFSGGRELAAYNDEQVVIGGFSRLDSYQDDYIRGVTNPIKLLGHEHEHIQDNIIIIEEWEKLKNLDDDEINLLFKDLEDEKDSVDLLEYTLEFEEEKYSAEQYMEKMNKIYLAKENIKTLEKEIPRKYFEKYPESPLLEQTYNKIAINSKENFYAQKEIKNLFKDMEKDMEKDILKRLKSLSQDYPEINFEEKDYSEELLVDNINDLMDKLSKENNLEIGELKEIFNKANYNFQISQSLEKNEEELFALLMDLEEFNIDEEYVKKSKDIFKMGTGLSHFYSLYNYARRDNEIYNAQYRELSSTLREQDESQIIQNLNSPIETVSSTTNQLVQIAFDSGKMDVEKYKRLMGEGACEKPDCCDKKCLIYKFLCEGGC